MAPSTTSTSSPVVIPVSPPQGGAGLHPRDCAVMGVLATFSKPALRTMLHHHRALAQVRPRRMTGTTTATTTATSTTTAMWPCRKAVPRCALRLIRIVILITIIVSHYIPLAEKSMVMGGRARKNKIPNDAQCCLCVGRRVRGGLRGRTGGRDDEWTGFWLHCRRNGPIFRYPLR